MKKFVLALICILMFSGMHGISESACIFTLINPSATDVALGLDSGTANIWNTSPLSVWSNPAKLGYHTGFAYGYSHDPWLEDSPWIDFDMYHQSSYISYGWNGIGILLPAPSAKNRWGTVMNYGEQEQTDEFGNVIGTFESYDACSKFALGINSLEFISNFITNENIRSLQYYRDLSIGFNYDIIHSDLATQGAGATPDSLSFIADAHSTGIGLIGRISPFNKMNALGGFCTLDITGGIYYLNPSKEEITYINDSDPLPWGTHSAFSGKFSLGLNIIQELDNENVRFFINNLFSIYYSQDNAQYGEKDEFNPSVWGEGIEYTFLDIFSIRKGQYVDREGEIVGDTKGYGLNLHYKDIIQFQYNKVTFPGGGLQYEQEKTDYLVKIDFLKAYELFR
ncbi:MAG: hypothetical protein ISS80_02175 [Candidatus Cloacimonetes bacterium]|nr:hypothetical protein [Candidatus Cloacimonadota bacterium]MBL7148859.1 hypothetical protein [Candidatus Cloacimonadota bacterium]